MAGEPGFEPGLTESESVVLPLDDSPVKKGDELTFRELRTFARLVQAYLLTLDLTGVTSQKTGAT